MASNSISDYTWPLKPKGIHSKTCPGCMTVHVVDRISDCNGIWAFGFTLLVYRIKTERSHIVNVVICEFYLQTLPYSLLFNTNTI